jgi:hypothetical protein
MNIIKNGNRNFGILDKIIKIKILEETICKI